jgi:sulfite reductase (NADPH) flavoprotein alpha-component
MMPATTTNLVAAAVLVAGWLVFAIASLRTHRRREQRATGGDAAGASRLWIVHASQTGFAERLAEQTAEVFTGAGLATRLASLNSLSAEALASAGRVLFVVSTTGEGDPPDNAIAFARRVLDRPATLGALQFGLLALGDRSYEDYCGFGRRLDAWLRHSGATALFDRVEVDDGDAAALRHWQHHLGRLSSRSDLPDWSPPRYGRWTLAARRLMNPGSLGGPVFHLELTPGPGEDATWTAGDIAEIGPEHSAAEVARWLARAGRDGAARVSVETGETTLARALARCVLPAEAPDRALGDQAWLDGLPRLPHREYSIASIPDDGGVHLLIRQLRRPDGSLGLGAGWLTEHAAVGAPIALRLSRNRAFHPPADAVPMILIGNGTGLAGLRALLHSRVRRPGTRQWLLFGERERARDFFHGEQLLALQASGRLERLDLAFSRDTPERVYVQQRLLDHADLVRQWVADGAAVYVCGSLDGMAPGVDAALSTILGAEALESLTTEGRYRRDVY